jgi:hypothetical protein
LATYYWYFSSSVGVKGICGVREPAGAGQRIKLVVIDLGLARLYFFIAAAGWRGATARDFEPLCKLHN